jgi:simple sugar transport system permease protein
VVSTLLLNFVALQLASWVLARQYLLQSTGRPGEPSSVLRAESDLVPESAHLPFLSQGIGFVLQFGIAIALPVALLAAFALARTRWGFNLRASGLNPRAARRFGVNVPLVGGSALVISGALAGLAGVASLTGGAYRVTPGFASNYGWEGLLAGLVAGFNPVLAVPVALLYGAVRAGGGLLTASGVSTNLTEIVQGLIVVAVTLPALYMRRRKRVRQLRIRERT